MAEVIRDNSYYKVVSAYYTSTMYEDDLSATELEIEEVDSVFNPVPKVINIAIDLSVGCQEKFIDDKDKYFEKVLKFNKFNKNKIEMMRELIKGKRMLVEVEKKEDEEYPRINFYNSDSYELTKDRDEILVAKIETKAFVLNADGTDYEEKEIKKIYIRDQNGNVEVFYEGDDIEGLEDTVLGDGIMPLTEMETGYDLKQLLNHTDKHNQIAKYIDKIFYLAGEPILFGRNLKKISQDVADEMSEDRFKKLKTLFTHAEAEVKFLEITGNSVAQMLNKQKALEENIINDYPEYSMSKVIAGSNVSTDTTRIRLSEIFSRINDLRVSFQNSLNEVMNICYGMEGQENEGSVELGSPLGTDLMGLMEKIKIAMELGLISKESAMHLIAELFKDEDVAKEMARLESEIELVNETNEIDGEDEENEDVSLEEEDVNV